MAMAMIGVRSSIISSISIVIVIVSSRTLRITISIVSIGRSCIIIIFVVISTLSRRIGSVTNDYCTQSRRQPRNSTSDDDELRTGM